MRYPWAQLSALAARHRNSPSTDQTLSDQMQEKTAPTSPRRTPSEEAEDSRSGTLSGVVVPLRKLILSGAYDKAQTILNQYDPHPGQGGIEYTLDAWIVAVHIEAALQGSGKGEAGEEHALQHLRAALVRGSNSELTPTSLMRLRSIERLFSGEPEQALAEYPSTVPPEMNEVRYHLERALIYLRISNWDAGVAEELRYDLARPWFEGSLSGKSLAELAPWSAQALAAIYRRFGMWAESALWLEWARSMGRKEHAARLAAAYLGLGRLCAQREPVRALAFWRAAAEASPSSSAAQVATMEAAMAIRRLCDRYAREDGALDPQLEELRECIRLAFDTLDFTERWARIDIWFLLCQAYVEIGEFAKALTVCEHLLKRWPGHTVAQLMRALLLIAEDAAETAYEFALPLTYEGSHALAPYVLMLAALKSGIPESRVLEELGEGVSRQQRDAFARATTRWAKLGKKGSHSSATDLVIETLTELLGRPLQWPSLEAMGVQEPRVGGGVGKPPTPTEAGYPAPPLKWWLEAEGTLTGVVATYLRKA